MRSGLRSLAIPLLLAVVPLAAYAPAVREGRILAPGRAAALELPLRVEVWRAYQRRELPSWNPSVFSGTPLLASYRPGALHPLMIALAPLPPLVAFQLLVLLSLAGTGPLVYALARRYGAQPIGGLLAGLAFALGPYLVGRLADTATIVAAPALVLVLLAAELHLARGRALSGAGLAGAVALLALAGSAEAAGAAAILLAIRLALALLVPRCRPQAIASAPLARRRLASTALALLAGLLLAAPQLVPTTLALRAAGPALPDEGAATGALGGVAGLIVRTVSRSPAAILTLAAAPLVLASPALRLVGLLACLAPISLAAGGQLEGAGALPLALDLGLALLAALSLSLQWAERRQPRGRRLRLHTFVVALAGAAALSVATTVTGPLPERLAGAVGLLALGLILYFTLAESPSDSRARLFLLPLVASFAMQPWSQDVWQDAPLARELEQPTPTRGAIDRAMGLRRAERSLVLTEAWPGARDAADLGWAAAAIFADRRSANGDDPLVPDLRRRALDGMRADGTLSRRLLESDPGRLELLGIRWLQVPTDTLVTRGDAFGPGADLGVVVEEPRPHLFALPITRATEVRMVSFLTGAAAVEQGRIVAECVARLASGREIWLPIKAGVDTAEWAWERSDVRDVVRHQRAQVFASFAAREGFFGHQYASVLRLPGRFAVASLRFRAWPGSPALWLLRVGLRDAPSDRSVRVALASAFASDEVRLALAAHTPLVSLFELRRGIGPAWVVPALRRVATESQLEDLLRSPTRLGLDARSEAIATEREAGELRLPAGSRSSPADLTRLGGARLLVRAAGPGLLVVAEGWDPGWRATLDGRPARVLRVNGDRMALALGPGHHRILLRHHARGFGAGLALALATLLLIAMAVLAERRQPNLAV